MYAMSTASVYVVAGRRSELAAEHVPECDPLVQSEELGVDREGRVFDGRAYLDGLTRSAVRLSVRNFELYEYECSAHGRDHCHGSGIP